MYACIIINPGRLENKDIKQESIFIQVGEHRLHMRRFYQDPEGEPIWMMHGSIEDGRIFYSPSGKGLASFLAAQGYDVIVADLRGRGKSTPAISKTAIEARQKRKFPYLP